MGPLSRMRAIYPEGYHPFSKGFSVTKGGIARMQPKGPMGPWAHAGPKGPAYKLGASGPSAGKAGNTKSEM